jgi:hypothetical protein
MIVMEWGPYAVADEDSIGYEFTEAQYEQAFLLLGQGFGRLAVFFVDGRAIRVPGVGHNVRDQSGHCQITQCRRPVAEWKIVT